MEAHQNRVASVARTAATFYQHKEPFRIYHGSTNSTRPSVRHRNQMVDTSGLNHVVHIGQEACCALVEPNVPMDALVSTLRPHGLVPPVIMEFPGITVGGGFCGTSGESSSFRYGFFDRTVSWIEMVLANGEIVFASKSENSDLFYGAASSFGTLGILTMLRLDLIEAAKFVQLTYHRVSSIGSAISKIKESIADPTNDYVDGILFSQDSGVICTGALTDDSPAPTQRFTNSTDPWFYLHAQDLSRGKREGELVTERVPLEDYLFRYDRGGFWMGRYAYTYFITPFNRITRWALNYFMHTRIMYHALHKSGQMKKYIIQDVAIPYPKALEFFEYVDETIGCYPLWICPLDKCGRDRTAPHDVLLTDATQDIPDLLLNFGVWCPGPTDRRKFIDVNRDLERKVHSLNGRKWLYALTYHTEDEFWSVYDRPRYDALRRKYHADHLPTIYDKVKVDVDAEEKIIQESWSAWLSMLFWNIWPLSGMYGVYKAALGGDYLLSREAFSRRVLFLRSVLVLCLAMIVRWTFVLVIKS